MKERCLWAVTSPSLLLSTTMWHDKQSLHWGRTLENKAVLARPHHKQNYTIPFQYNYTEYKLSQEKNYWDGLIELSKTQSMDNSTIRHAENAFLKKTKMLADMLVHSVKHQSFTMVIVIASLFLFFTVAITIAVIVFCRKRNTVFALQKSEQDDNEYEMDDIQTDLEYTETDFESETDSIRTRTRSISQSAMDSDGENSSLYCAMEYDKVETLPVSPTRFPTSIEPKRGGYQRVMVNAVMERLPIDDGCESDTEEQHPVIYNEAKAAMLRNLYRKYYGARDKDNNEDDEQMPLKEHIPSINVTCADASPNCEYLSCVPDVVVTISPEDAEYPDVFECERNSNANNSSNAAASDSEKDAYIEIVCHSPDKPESIVLCATPLSNDASESERRQLQTADAAGGENNLVHLAQTVQRHFADVCDNEDVTADTELGHSDDGGSPVAAQHVNKMVTRTDSGSSSERTDSDIHGSQECLIKAGNKRS